MLEPLCLVVMLMGFIFFKGSGGVELSLDPSELDGLDSESMAARYEQTLREQQGNLAKEDFSDMVAEHAAKQKVSLFIIAFPFENKFILTKFSP